MEQVCPTGHGPPDPPVAHPAPPARLAGGLTAMSGCGLRIVARRQTHATGSRSRCQGERLASLLRQMSTVSHMPARNRGAARVKASTGSSTSTSAPGAKLGASPASRNSPPFAPTPAPT